MRRKKVDRLEGVPAELARFDASKWESFDVWKAARSEWSALNAWPGGLLAKIIGEREARLLSRGRGDSVKRGSRT